MAARTGTKAKRSRTLGVGWAEWPWLLCGAVASAAWFALNIGLPALYKGRICCDSTDYIKVAQSLTRWADLFDYAYTNDRTIGWPAFLYFHRVLVSGLKLDGVVDWVNAALVSTAVLHVLALWFFYRSAVKMGLRLHPIALALVIATPALASHAAVPLADSLGNSLFCVTLGILIRADLAQGRRATLMALLSGLALGASMLVRPVIQVPAFALFPALALLEVWRARSNRTKLPLQKIGNHALAALVFLSMLVPSYFACTRYAGTLCIVRPYSVNTNIYYSLNMGLYSPRTYGSFDSKIFTGQVTHPDNYLKATFGKCFIRQESIGRDLAACFWVNLASAPLYVIKKLVGLFDCFYLNAYAVNITRPWQTALNRIFGGLEFVGFCALTLAWLRRLKRGRRDLSAPWLGGGFLIISYIFLSTVRHGEARYGFPAVPAAIFAFVFLVQETFFKDGLRGSFDQLVRHPKTAIGCALAAAIFFGQVWDWDSYDLIKQEADQRAPIE